MIGPPLSASCSIRIAPGVDVVEDLLEGVAESSPSAEDTLGTLSDRPGLAGWLAELAASLVEVGTQFADQQAVAR